MFSQRFFQHLSQLIMFGAVATATAACSLRSAPSATVSIDTSSLRAAGIGTASRVAQSPQNSNVAPTLAQMNCLALNVTGPSISPSSGFTANSCGGTSSSNSSSSSSSSSGNGTATAGGIGLISATFPVSQSSIVLQVPSGQATFTLLGYASPSGTCENLADLMNDPSFAATGGVYAITSTTSDIEADTSLTLTINSSQTAFNEVLCPTSPTSTPSPSPSPSASPNPAAPAISYSGSPFTFTAGAVIPPIGPTNTGAAITNCTFVPTLPSGMSMSTTCTIAGVPTTAQGATAYTVTAFNGASSSSTTITISINPPAPQIAYTNSPFIFTAGTSVGIQTVANGGGMVTTCTISPTIPSGLYLANDCTISGTPTTAQSAMVYNVTAFNGPTPDTISFTIEVDSPPPAPNLIYPNQPYFLTVGTPVSETPSNSGGTITNCSITPTLPSGLFFSSSNCMFYGTPVAPMTLSPYTVTAYNGASSSSVTIPIQITAAVALPIISAGSETSCEVESTQLACWGMSTYGELGNATSGAMYSSPTLISLPPVSAVTSGERHTCAMIQDGQLYCWGNNAYGELGINNTTDSNVPTSVAISAVTSVSAGANFTCAVSSGQGYCWGAGTAGQLGDGMMSNQSGPTPITMGSVSQISAGRSEHACAIDDSGNVYCWGGNSGGEIGNGTTTPTSNPQYVFSNVQQVVTGYVHTCALSTSGQVSCWGDNTYGQLAQGSVGGLYSLPMNVTGLPPVVQLSAGDNHTCAVTSSNMIYCWGQNQSGQLGNGTATNSPTPVMVLNQSYSPLTGVSQVAAGTHHTCAITNSNQTYCWGDNGSGELGNGSTSGNTLAIQANPFP